MLPAYSAPTSYLPDPPWPSRGLTDLGVCTVLVMYLTVNIAII